MRSPHDLDKDDLAELVETIQRQLYLQSDPKLTFIWNPSKDVDCQAFVDILDELMARKGLHPAFVPFRKPFVHRPGEVEYEEEADEGLDGPRRRNPELSIREGRLLAHITPSMELADILFPETLSKLLLLRRQDVEDLKVMCDKLLEFLKE